MGKTKAINVNVTKTYSYTEEDLADLLSAGLTGSEWFSVDNTTPEYLETKKSMDDPYLEEVLAHMLFADKPIRICADIDEDGSYSEEHDISLADMINGIRKTIEDGWSGNVDDADYIAGDSILQYACWGEQVFG